MTVNEIDLDSTLFNKKQQLSLDLMNHTKIPYYYSPSSVVMRQQKQLKLLKFNLEINKENKELISTLGNNNNNDFHRLSEKIRLKHSNVEQNILNQKLSNIDPILRHIVSDTHTSNNVSKRIENRHKPTTQHRYPLQKRSQTIANPNDSIVNQDNDNERRITNLEETNNQKPLKVFSENSHHSRNTSIKKLKSFFGEKVIFFLLT